MIIYGTESESGNTVNVDILEAPSSRSIVNAARPESCLQISSHGPSFCPSLAELQSAWFLTPDAWVISPVKHENLTPVSNGILKRYICKTQDWLREWALKGSNPFIHSRLYKVRSPRCIQDAFMAVSSYVSRSPGTEDMVYRIVEERATELVALEGSQQHQSQFDPFDQMSRVQALLMYSIIRLFDGDIRQRHLAEKHLPVLHSWTLQMRRTTAIAAQNGTLLLSNSIETDPLYPGNIGPVEKDQEKLLWNAWILSESLRRTWFLSEHIYCIYTNMQQGWAECPGAMMVTSRKGVWEAESAFAWTKICAERNVGFIHKNDTERVMREAKPAEVDPFCLALMEVDFGLEKMDRWRIESGD